MEFLRRSRHTDDPRAVSEVPLQLPLDRAAGEGHELRTVVGIESIHRLHQAVEGHLTKIVDVAPGRREPLCDVDGESGVALDQKIPDARDRPRQQTIGTTRRRRRRPVSVAGSSIIRLGLVSMLDQRERRPVGADVIHGGANDGLRQIVQGDRVGPSSTPTRTTSSSGRVSNCTTTVSLFESDAATAHVNTSLTASRMSST